jgi:hypothetical protein
MRRAVALAVLTLAAAPLTAYQEPPDGRGEAKATLAGKKIEIEYGRPSLKGRDMLAQAPVGFQWRLGSNDATRLATDADLAFATVVVPAGKYVLKATRAGAEAWVLNVLTGDDKVVVDVPLTKATLPASVETFTIKLTPDAQDKKAGVLELEWGTTALRAPFKVK